MNTLSERLKEAMEAAGMSQVALARACKVSQPSVAGWLNGATKKLRSDTAVAAACALNLNVRWLVDGTGPRYRTQICNQSGLDTAEIGFFQIPLIEFKDVGSPLIKDLYPYLLTDMDISEKAFAVAIKDSSMMPKFEIGDKVIIDPSTEPIPGDFVVLRADQNEPIFRKIRDLGIDSNGSHVYEFIPLNNDFSVIRSDRHHVDILGTMLEHRKYRKP